MPSKIEREAAPYRARLDKTLADGKVTEKEADALIKNAKDGHFSQVEAHYLSGFVDRPKHAFDPEARAKLVAFVSGEMESLAKIADEAGVKNPTRQPKLTDDARKLGMGIVHYETREGTLTVNGFGVDDATQGQVGDCYFISALASVAKNHPELLAKAVKTNRDGTYSVTFFERKTGAPQATPVTVTIDGAFPMQNGRLAYAAARETKELWPLIFEKAYASWKGSYQMIESGMGANALEALTGAAPGFFPVTSDSNPDVVFKRLQDALAGKGCVTANSKPWDPAAQGVVADHAYTLLSVSEKNGERFVQLRNPWGEREPGHDGKDDGTFNLPLSKFLTSYAMVEFAKP